ncbi:MAG TPA: protoglobin domain-containing protein [Pirellulaceae bacterium]|nr:protoglobin domain-containing protein [Pirellulaceae bacterium]
MATARDGRYPAIHISPVVCQMRISGFFRRNPFVGDDPLSAYQRYQELQGYVSWTPEDAQRVQAIAPLVTPHFTALVDDFYAEIRRHPDAAKVITGGEEQINRLKKTLIRWLEELFSGCYDREYVERRWRVGYRHVEIGLDQVYTNVALSRLRRGLLLAIERDWKESIPDLLAIRASLNTLLDLDLAIIEDAYQTEFQRRQAAAERLATIGKVAGGIAHELRNPLNVVKTSVYFILNAKNASPEKIKTHLQRIERQVGVADGVITALNDFSRLPVPQMDRVDLESCLKDVLEVTTLPRNLQVEWALGSPSPAVLGDRAQLHIVFSNLIRNARDAMPEGGTLRFAAASNRGHVDIQVQDTGIGIPAEDLSRIMEPLYSTKAKGIGLGLSIAQEIVGRHNGSLRVASQQGVGTTFTIRLPRAS